MHPPVLVAGISPFAYVVAGLGLSFFAWTRWSGTQRRTKALALLDDERSYAEGRERELARALSDLTDAKESVGAETQKAISALLVKRRAPVLRMVDRYLELVRKTSLDAETSTPEEEAGSDLFAKIVDAYGDDPSFRRELARRLHGESSESVWFDVLLEVTCHEGFLEDGDAFRSVLDAFAALPDDGEVWRSSNVASMVVEWAFEAGATDRLRPLRARFEAQRERAEDKAPWDELLQDFDASIESTPS